MRLPLKEILDEISRSNPEITKSELFKLAKEHVRKEFLSSYEYEMVKEELEDRIWGDKD